MLNDNNTKKKNYHNVEIEYTFIKSLFLDMFFSLVFKYLDKFLSSFVCNYISIFSFFRSDFFILKNEDINAKFLSRYIARKLQQGYRFRRVINPIKSELKRLISLLRPFSSLKIDNNNLIDIDRSFLKGFFVRLINFSNFFCRVEFFKFYINSYC
jgi:hypothetical protein